MKKRWVVFYDGQFLCEYKGGTRLLVRDAALRRLRGMKDNGDGEVDDWLGGEVDPAKLEITALN